MTVNLIIILIIYFAFSEILMLPAVEIAMWLIGFLFLLYIGIESIKEAKQSLKISDTNLRKKSLFKSYSRGIIMAVTPSNIVFWIGVFGTALTTAIKNMN